MLIPVGPPDHARGPVESTLTVVQYGDYDCPHTRASTGILHGIEASLGVPVRFVYRHFPLRHIHANAQRVAQLAEAAEAQGRFWDVHERLMRIHHMAEAPAMEALAAAGLDMTALLERAATPDVIERVERDVASGKAVGAHSTPTWFFNGTLWDGHYDEATLLARIREALGTSKGEP